MTYALKPSSEDANGGVAGGIVTEIEPVTPATIARRIPAELPVTPSTEAVRQFDGRFQAARRQVLTALRAAPALAQLVQGLQAAKSYVIEWPPEALTALKDGSAAWQSAADGTLPAVVRLKDNNEIVKHLRLRESGQLTGQGLAALNNLAIQSTLAQVLRQIEELDTKLERVLEGARADRLGLILAGEHLYAQALVAKDADNRRSILHSALQSLGQGRGQLMASIAAEARLLQPPSGSAWPFMETPSQKLGRQLKVLGEDAKAVALATRSVILVHEELGEPGMAKVALDQFWKELAVPAQSLKELAAYAPYAPGDNPAQVWSALSDRLIPSSKVASGELSAPASHQPLLMEFNPGELLLG
jgi:hypothetical protein